MVDQGWKVFDVHVLPVVRKRIEAWLGEPDSVLSNPFEYQGSESPFRSLSYTRGHTMSVSLGASAILIPGSQARYSDPSGMRHEYILHHAGTERNFIFAANVLRALALFPVFADRFVFSGSVIHLGDGLRILNNTERQYIYLTDPYEDDPKLYTPTPCGQIRTEDSAIQFLWAIPIHESEYRFIKLFGYEKFEESYLKPTTNYADWDRQPSV